MNFDTTLILTLVSFTIGLVAGISMIRPRYRQYTDHMYDRRHML